MYYCFKCDIAGDIDYEWCGKVACYKCGGELEKGSYEWIKEQGFTKISKAQREEVEIEWP